MTEIVTPAAVVIPYAGAVLAFVAGQRGAKPLGLLTAALTTGAAGLLAWSVLETGAVRHEIGGWGAPLGIDLVADGLGTAMVAATAAIGLPVTVYAARYFPPDQRGLAGWTSETAFWPLWLFLWAALNTLFLSGDAFNLYIGLELVTLAAVGLVVLGGNRVALMAGLRYLLAAFFASLAYLLGVAFLYLSAGTLDLAIMSGRLEGAPAVPAAVVLMTMGLALKAALFPLHFWLPDAHSRAPTPASAVLSGLVIMAAIYLLIRLWLQVFPPSITVPGSQLVGAAGVVALLWGSVRAIRSRRLKLLLAWSTVAQVGLVAIVLPVGLAGADAATVAASLPALGDGTAALAGPNAAPGNAWQGGALLAAAHGLAKASLFLAAGVLIHARGHDRLGELHGAGRHLPLTVAAIVLAGASLAGVPGTGGEAGKHLLVEAAAASGQWWWELPLNGSILLTAAYVLLVLWRVVRTGPAGRGEPVPLAMQAAPLVLALMAVGLGLAEHEAVLLLQAGAP
jgi:multicomponent Na+:H+ antiporter subunit D